MVRYIRIESPIVERLRPYVKFDVVELIKSKLFLHVFAAIGILYIFTKLFSFVRLLASLFMLPGKSTRDFGPPGSWAVVTGASDGIGKEFAKHLANRRFNIILVSRTASKLEALAAELANNKYKIETKTLAMDFTRNDDADYARLADLTRDLDVSILINNVGQSHSIPVPFLKTSLTEMQDIVTVNCLGTLRVTQTIAPGMVERKRGLVLTMASFGGILPTPLLATYSGSKAFLQQWSTALGAELEPQGVTVQLVQSYLVTSAMSKIRKASMFVPDPKSFVEKTMDKIGRSGGAQGIAYTCTPYWAHAFMHWGIATFVGTTNKFVLKRNYDMHKQIRTRALKKADRDSKKGL